MTSKMSAVACVLLSAGLLAQSEAQSTGPARELVRQLGARHLEAIAARDPLVPGRFIAALYIAPSQLLVVGASHASSEAVAYKLIGDVGGVAGWLTGTNVQATSK